MPKPRTKPTLDEQIEHYMRLPYTVTVVYSEDSEGNSGYVSSIDELSGCMSQGRTIPEAIERVYDAMLGWLSVMIEDGREIPEPREFYSGQFMLRLPRGLHGELVRCARKEGVSLNQFAAMTLAGAVGWGGSK